MSHAKSKSRAAGAVVSVAWELVGRSKFPWVPGRGGDATTRGEKSGAASLGDEFSLARRSISPGFGRRQQYLHQGRSPQSLRPRAKPPHPRYSPSPVSL